MMQEAGGDRIMPPLAEVCQKDLWEAKRVGSENGIVGFHQLICLNLHLNYIA